MRFTLWISQEDQPLESLLTALVQRRNPLDNQ